MKKIRIYILLLLALLILVPLSRIYADTEKLEWLSFDLGYDKIFAEKI